MKLLLKNVDILDPFTGDRKEIDILVDGSKVKRIARNITDKDASIIDAKDKIAMPGLVDVHVHFREPGQEYKETIYTGSRAAAAGGFTTVVAEPNTEPPIDTPSRIKKILKVASDQSIVNFYSKASITRRTEGKRLVDVRALKAAGAVAISDDGHPVYGARLMKNALEAGAKYDILVSSHCEESESYRQRVIKKNRGRKYPPSSPNSMPYSSSSKPYTSEEGLIKRDIEIAERAGARIHISHVSRAESVEIIAKAKKRGVAVTAEATPHHFLLSEKDAEEIGTNAKVNPPLRSEEDVAAIKSGLIDGTIDIIATDHAPHSPQEKSVSWEQAPFGIIGLETALGLVLTYLVQPKLLTISQAIEKMSVKPAQIYGLSCGGSLMDGQPADMTIIDPKKNWRVNADEFYSKGRNCPFDGWELCGKAIMTIVAGRVVMKDGQIVEGGAD